MTRNCENSIQDFGNCKTIIKNRTWTIKCMYLYGIGSPMALTPCGMCSPHSVVLDYFWTYAGFGRKIGTMPSLKPRSKKKYPTNFCFVLSNELQSITNIWRSMSHFPCYRSDFLNHSKWKCKPRYDKFKSFCAWDVRHCFSIIKNYLENRKLLSWMVFVPAYTI